MRLTSTKAEFPISKQLQELSIFHANKDLKQTLLKKVAQMKRMRHEEFAEVGQAVADFDHWTNVLAGQRIDTESIGDNVRRLAAFQAIVDWLDNDMKEVGNPVEAWWTVVAIWLTLAKYGVANLIADESKAVEGEPNILLNGRDFRPATVEG